MSEEIIDVSKLSDMMQQYMTIKENYSDCLLFFRLGDFYELYWLQGSLSLPLPAGTAAWRSGRLCAACPITAWIPIFSA